MASQVRKAGDTLLLSGRLKGSLTLLSSDADWVGASGTIHIVNKKTGALIRDDPCTIIAPDTATQTLARYEYIGAPMAFSATASDNKYLYEVQVSFIGLSDPITFPNNKAKFELEIVNQLA